LRELERLDRGHARTHDEKNVVVTITQGKMDSLAGNGFGGFGVRQKKH